MKESSIETGRAFLLAINPQIMTAFCFFEILKKICRKKGVRYIVKNADAHQG